MTDIFTTIASKRLVPVVTIDRVEDAKPLAEALKAGGLPVAEITFRTAVAADALRAIAGDRDMLLGAGTVLTTDHAMAAQDAGARFIVSPGFSPKVVEWCLANRMPIIPGVCTPTEIQAALEYGLTVVKFFPASSYGGSKTLKTLATVYGGMRFMPTGGIDAGNLAEYLAIGSVLACGGSWMCTKDLIRDKRWTEITAITAQALAAIARPVA